MPVFVESETNEIDASHWALENRKITPQVKQYPVKTKYLVSDTHISVPVLDCHGLAEIDLVKNTGQICSNCLVASQNIDKQDVQNHMREDNSAR